MTADSLSPSPWILAERRAVGGADQDRGVSCTHLSHAAPFRLLPEFREILGITRSGRNARVVFSDWGEVT